MSRWREKGFVQDTDEEDELDNSTSSPGPPRRNAHQVLEKSTLASSPELRTRTLSENGAETSSQDCILTGISQHVRYFLL
jgi:hypothetical protein